jgi:hypothetical protein
LLTAIIVGSVPWIKECFEMVMDGVGVVKYGEAYDYGSSWCRDNIICWNDNHGSRLQKEGHGSKKVK